MPLGEGEFLVAYEDMRPHELPALEAASSAAGAIARSGGVMTAQRADQPPVPARYRQIDPLTSLPTADKLDMLERADKARACVVLDRRDERRFVRLGCACSQPWSCAQRWWGAALHLGQGSRSHGRAGGPAARERSRCYGGEGGRCWRCRASSLRRQRQRHFRGVDEDRIDAQDG